MKQQTKRLLKCLCMAADNDVVRFPEEPYNRIRFNAKGGAFTVTSLTIYPFK